MSKRYKKRINGNRGIKNFIWFKTYGKAKKVPCHWCQKLLTFNEATFDHEPALCLGGEKDKGVIACRKCNHDRGIIQNKLKQSLQNAA